MSLIKNTLITSIAGCALISSSFGAIVASSNISVVSNNEQSNRQAINVLSYDDLTVQDSTGLLDNLDTVASTVNYAFHSASTATAFNYSSGTPATPTTIDFTFATAETIDAIHIWNFGFDRATRSVQDFSVELFDAGDVSLGTFNFTATQAPEDEDATTIASQTFSLGNAFEVSSANFTLLTNYGDARVGLGRVAFEVSTIPEPGHVALGFAGIAALAICLKRRAAKKA